jgi:glycine/D-amino acid oxidase-like deaminating enzyme
MISDVRTESPFWLMKNGFLEVYPVLTEDVAADFAIVGGGISGALQAWHLSRKGATVVLVDARHVGMNSTAASTALLQYDIDRTLHELIDIFGEKKAVRAYEMSLNALLALEEIARKLPIENNFERRSSVYFAEYEKDLPFLEREVRTREKYGYAVELWDAEEVKKRFPFDAPGALYTNPGAIVDPYRLTHGLLQDAMKMGARVFDKTLVNSIERHKNGVTLHTSQGYKVAAKKVVVACGYETINYLPPHLVKLYTTYAIISKPLPVKDIWFENAVFWDTGNPYIYGRTTADNRVIFGGGDEPFYSPEKREELHQQKTNELIARFENMFPDLPFHLDFCWAGTFIETEDGLPYIGSIENLPHTYFALGYGGNGITFSQLAAEILCDLLMGKENEDAEIYSFARKKNFDFK